MITLSVLLIGLLVIAAVVFGVTLLFGGAFIAIFGDLILFGLAIWLIVKFFRRKKKK